MNDPVTSIIVVDMPGSVLKSKKYNAICFRVGGLSCCNIYSPLLYSNTVCKYLPPPPLPPQPPVDDPNPPQPPVPCIGQVDISGFKMEINYNAQECKAGHRCNRAIFNVYINDIFIGKANLNNATTGGNVFTSFTIPAGVASINNTYTIKLIKDSSITVAHNGIAQVVIKDLSNNIIYKACLPNDQTIYVPQCQQ